MGGEPLTEEEVAASGKLFRSDPLIIGGKLYLVTGSSVVTRVP